MNVTVTVHADNDTAVKVGSRDGVTWLEVGDWPAFVLFAPRETLRRLLAQALASLDELEAPVLA